VLVLDAARVGDELADDTAIRELARAIADGRADDARGIAAELLERSA
jgi:hypothetical protein